MRRLTGVAIVVMVALTALMLANCMQQEITETDVTAKKEPQAKEPVQKLEKKEEKPREQPLVQETKLAKASELELLYRKSLHATGEGMRYWYEENNGFAEITGIPYRDLDCKKCHAASCDKCHALKEDGTVSAPGEGVGMGTCLKCHARTKAAMAMDKAAGIEDVHFAAGLVCTDCHGKEDVHGDGNSYHSMRDPGAVKASCSAEDCHDDLDMTIKPHRKHVKDIDCTACHVSSTVTCLNCHFDRFLEEKKRKGNFFAGKSWTLLVNHEGKVTAGNAQTLVAKGKKFVTYVPYFTHSVVREGKGCRDCHGAPAAIKMYKGESVEMAAFKDGKVTHYEGVVPFMPDLIKWPWLDKDAEGWKKLESEEKAKVQEACYAKPITKKQLKKLKRKIGR